MLDVMGVVKETGQKLLYMESLRGIAAFVVVLTHFAAAFFPVIMSGPSQPMHLRAESWIYGTPLAVLFGGNFSVCLFFVLSGFVLTQGFFATGRMDILTRGVMKRYVRLMPPVLAAVLLTFIVLQLGWNYSQEAARFTGSAWLASLWHFKPDLVTALRQSLYEAFFLGTDGSAGYNPVLWTMQIEFMGSLLVFGMAAVLRGFPRRGWVYALLVAATWQNYYLGFVFGLILADLVHQEALWRKVRTGVRKWWWLGVIGVSLVLGGFPSTGNASGTMYEAFPLPFSNEMQAVAIWHALGALLMVIAVLAWPGKRSLLMARPLVALGRQSFALYLIHGTVIGTLSCYLFTSLRMSSHGYVVSFVLTFGASLGVILSLSYLFTRWVDQPAIVLAQRFAAGGPMWRRKRPVVAVPVPTPSLAPVRAGAPELMPPVLAEAEQ